MRFGCRCNFSMTLPMNRMAVQLAHQTLNCNWQTAPKAVAGKFLPARTCFSLAAARRLKKNFHHAAQASHADPLDGRRFSPDRKWRF
jgi:hypothetical protein